MNSILDPREAYFRNRVTNLLSKGTVVKALNNKPQPKEELKSSHLPAQQQAATKLKSKRSGELVSSVCLQ
jgi:hypothetical protein